MELLERDSALERELLLELYKDLLKGLGNRPARLFLYGGRGTGKSTVLHGIRGQMGGGETIDGASGDSGLTRLFEAAKETAAGRPPFILFLDDLDRLLPFAYMKDPQTLGDTLGSLLKLSISKPGEERRFVVSSTLSPNRLHAQLSRLQTPTLEHQLKVDMFSSFLTRFEYHHLDPWPQDWRNRLRRLVAQKLDAQLSKAQIEMAADVLEELTGGHPSLAILGLVRLRRLAEESNTAFGAKDHLKGLLEDHLVRTGFQAVRRSLRSLEGSASAETEEVLGVLWRIARGDEPDHPVPIQVREILQDEGLAYTEGQSRRTVVPGSLLRAEIQRTSLVRAPSQPSTPPQKEAQPSPLPAATAGQRQAVELRMVPDRNAPTRRGHLEISQGEERHHLALSGEAWVILAKLVAEPDRVFSLTNLGRSSGNKPAAARSAIQRLTDRLRRAGIADVVTNVHGKGYRLGRAVTRTTTVPSS